MDVQQILKALNQHHIRATYGAVGEVLGLPAIGVGRHLGNPRPEASWIVSAATGKPSGYSEADCHPKLFSRPEVLRTGAQLQALMSKGKISPSPPKPKIKPKPARLNSKSKKRVPSAASRSIQLPYSGTGKQLAGVDLAWMSENNGSGIAIGEFTGDQITVQEIHCGVIGLSNVTAILDQCQALWGVAVDAPLIIKNPEGARPCEEALNIVYRPKWAGCYPSNLSRFPDAASIELSRWLEKKGLPHLGLEGSSGWQIECYPHPAIIELFGLSKRLKYKKGSPQEKIEGQIALARHIRSLEHRPALRLAIPKSFEHFLAPDYIRSLTGRTLKHNEDALGALVCLYIAGLYGAGQEMAIFGESQTGYIVVPRPGP